MNKPRAQRPPQSAGRRIVLVLCAVLMGAGVAGICRARLDLGISLRLSELCAHGAHRPGRARRRPLCARSRAGPCAARRLCRGRHHHRGRRPAADESGGEQVAGAPILAVGNSFTYGDEVNDGQTWPAQLQLLTGRRVLNARRERLRLRPDRAARRAAGGEVQAGGDRRELHRRRHPAHRDAPAVERRQALLRDRRRQARPARRAGAAARRSRQHAQRSGNGRWATPTSFDFILRRLDLLHDWYGDHMRVQRAGHRRAPLLPADRAAGRAAEARAAPGSS